MQSENHPSTCYVRGHPLRSRGFWDVSFHQNCSFSAFGRTAPQDPRGKWLHQRGLKSTVSCQGYYENGGVLLSSFQAKLTQKATINTHTDTETDSDRETQRHKDTDTQRNRHTDTQTDTQTDTETDSDRATERHKDVSLSRAVHVGLGTTNCYAPHI